MVRERRSFNKRQGADSKAPVEDAGDASSRGIKKIDRTIMDNFYKLVHTQPNVRLTAACSTYKILVALKNRDSANFNHHLNYCVERLVRGLASSRAMARKGYATLLLEILKKNQISTERLLKIAQLEFGNISNETSKDNLLGYYLLMNVILESVSFCLIFRKIKQKDTYVEKMYKILRQLIDQKSYFDYPISKLFCQRYDIFHEHMLADIPAAAFGSDSRLTHTELLLIALCNKHKGISQFASLDSKDVLKMSEALKGDRLKRRPLHPVWIEWSLTVSKHSESLYKDYIENIVHPTFFKPNHNELAAMGLELTAELLPMIISTLYKCTLNDYIIRLLITSLRSRNSLHKHCMQFFSKLSQTFAKEREVNSYVNHQAIILRLMEPPGSITFDLDSKSNVLSNLLNSCDGTALEHLANYIIRQFDVEMRPADRERTLPVAGKLLAHMVSRPQFRSTSGERREVPNIVKWLIVNSLFAGVDPLANEKEFWIVNKRAMPVKQPLDLPTRSSLRTAYHAIMDYVVTTLTAQERIVTLGSFIDFCNQLIHHGAVFFYEHTGDITRTWQVYMVGLIEYRNLCNAHGDPKILYPISSLYLLYGLQIVEHGLDCREQLTELYQAAKDAIKNDPSDGSWADILTDQIIAFLSATECKSWIRKLCVSVFGSLVPHITETSIDLLCDVMRAPITNTCDEENSDEENSDECSEMDVQETANNESVGRQDGEKHQGLGENHEGADEDGDEDDAEEEYLNDEEMMKLDSVLVDMFKSRAAAKKKKKKRNPRDDPFKLRCLGLVKKVLAKHNCSDLRQLASSFTRASRRAPPTVQSASPDL